MSAAGRESAGLLCQWARAVHACIKAGEAKWGKPYGMTIEELEAALGPAPFDRRVAGELLRRMASKGWLEGRREPATVSVYGGSQVRVRYFVRYDMPTERRAPRNSSYFDGLVRVSSVFELGRALARQGAAR